MTPTSDQSIPAVYFATGRSLVKSSPTVKRLPGIASSSAATRFQAAAKPAGSLQAQPGKKSPLPS